MPNRKLIRPNLSDLKDRLPKSFGQRRSVPPTDTNAENYYYLKQMNQRTPMTLILVSGEEVQGRIEWYDRDCLKVNRDDSPNLLIMKHQIRYIFKREGPGRNGNHKRRPRN